MTGEAAETVEAPRKELAIVGLNDLPHVWELIEPTLQRLIEESRGELSLPMILHNLGVDDGVERWRLLAIFDGDDVQALMLVYVHQMENGKRRLHCLAAAGERAEEWPLVDPQLKRFARKWGCERIRIQNARKGWKWILKHWRIVGYVMEMEA